MDSRKTPKHLKEANSYFRLLGLYHGTQALQVAVIEEHPDTLRLRVDS